MTLLAALRRIGSHLRAGLAWRLAGHDGQPCLSCARIDELQALRAELDARVQRWELFLRTSPEPAAAPAPSPTGRLAAGSPSDYSAIWHVKGCRQDCPGHPLGYEHRPDPWQDERTGG